MLLIEVRYVVHEDVVHEDIRDEVCQDDHEPDYHGDLSALAPTRKVLLVNRLAVAAHALLIADTEIKADNILEVEYARLVGDADEDF